MNHFVATGSAWKPEVKLTQSGMAIFSCGLGLYDGKDQAGKAKYFTLQVKAFKEVAEAAGDLIQERDNIIVTGRMSQESWDDKTTGKKQYKLLLIADCIAKDSKQFAKKDTAADPAAAFGSDVPDDDTPPF